MNEFRQNLLREFMEPLGRLHQLISDDFSENNRQEALREIAMDIEEGADIVMVKPALAYLDIIREASSLFHFPMAAYAVSGEYSMIKAAAEKGWADEKKLVLEIMTSLSRAGAQILISYHAKTIGQWRLEGAEGYCSLIQQSS